MSSAFAHFLRTGQKLDAPLPLRHEAKFNPWHDPANGRFTHVGMGRNYPRGFGGFRGGQSGGGGASGTWRDGDVRVARDAPKPQAQTKPPQQVAQPVIPGPASASPNQRPASRSYPIVRSVERNGYAFSIDTLDRTRKVTGQLQHGPATNRSRSMQSRAGRPDRRPTDDGGHYIARRFNGPREKFNHFVLDANFNRGGTPNTGGRMGAFNCGGRKYFRHHYTGVRRHIATT